MVMEAWKAKSRGAQTPGIMLVWLLDVVWWYYLWVVIVDLVSCRPWNL